MNAIHDKLYTLMFLSHGVPTVTVHMTIEDLKEEANTSLNSNDSLRTLMIDYYNNLVLNHNLKGNDGRLAVFVDEGSFNVEFLFKNFPCESGYRIMNDEDFPSQIIDISLHLGSEDGKHYTYQG